MPRGDEKRIIAEKEARITLENYVHSLERPQLVSHAFIIMDKNRTGFIDAPSMKPFAEKTGFEGSSEEWAAEFVNFCSEWGLNDANGIDEITFGKMVDDDTEIGCKTEDLEFREFLLDSLAKLKVEARHKARKMVAADLRACASEAATSSAEGEAKRSAENDTRVKVEEQLKAQAEEKATQQAQQEARLKAEKEAWNTAKREVVARESSESIHMKAVKSNLKQYAKDLGTFKKTLKSVVRVEDAEIDKLLLASKSCDGDFDVDEFLSWLFAEGSALPVARRRVAVYGGAFDPITNGHLAMAAQIVQSGCADEVWVVPSGPRPDKPKLKTPVVDRYCMCQVAINTCFSEDFPIFVSDIECGLDEAFATYDLLNALKRKHLDADFSFVIGSDWLQAGSNMAEWMSKNWDWKPGDPEDQRYIVTGAKMLSEFDFLVVKRPGYDVDTTSDDPTGLKKFGPRLSWLEMPPGVTFVQGNLSSTEIRKRAVHLSTEEIESETAASSRALTTIEGLVPRSIVGYIRRVALYGHGPGGNKRPFLKPPTSHTGEGARQRVAIYGGAFDPITNSHLTCAAQIIHSGCADAVWLVPCGPRPDKPKLKTPPLDRYCMCKIAVNFAFSVDFPVEVDAVECFSPEAFATYDLLCSLRAEHNDKEFIFLIGSDWLQPGSNMAEWTSKNWDWKPGDPEDKRTIVTGDKLLKEFDFLVLKRPGYDVPATPDDPTGLKQFGPRLSWLDMPEGMTFIEGNLSSTEVRKRSNLRLQWGLEGLTPPGVISFITRKRLYGT